MFRQLLTPVADSLGLSFIVASLPILDGAGPARTAAPTRLAGVACRSRRRFRRRGRRLATARRTGGRRRAQRRRLRAVAGDVDRVQRDAALQHRRHLRPLRRLPPLDARPSAQRPPHRPGGDRLLLRRAARGRVRLRHASGDHRLAADPGRLPAARGAGFRADLQHGAGRLRRARRAGHRAGRA